MGILIYLSLTKSTTKVFSTKHISWIEWVNKEKNDQYIYKQFIVSPSESRIYVETASDKYIVDAHRATLNSALSINPKSGAYHFVMFNQLNGAKIGVFTPIKETNQWLLPLSLLVIALITTIVASALYLKENGLAKLKKMIHLINESFKVK